MKFAAGAAVILACAGAAWAQHGSLTKNPYTSPEDAAAGGRIFRSHCAVCHAIDGTGGRGTDLTTGYFRRGSSDEDLYNTISNGIPGTEMPGIFFNGKQMWQLVAYVRSLSERKDGRSAAGDPQRGRELFFGKGACSTCHMVNGEGARTGPDLSDAGAQRSYAHLRESILNPDEQVLPKHWRVTAVTNDGRAITGVRLNEGTYSIQVLDDGERLLSLLKSDLREYEIVKKSSMPSYEGRFTAGELEDLLAYLLSLKRGRPTP